MTYSEAIDWLFNLNRFGMKLGLENIENLAAALGSPQERFRSILVGGTNGKGSTAAMLHQILLAAGLRSGLYTSPHLVRAEERIRIGDRDIGTEDLTRILGQIRVLIEQLLAGNALGAHPTFFEVMTAAAFVAFERSGVEIAILEVGLGGRLDATNIVSPELSIITGIDFDHMEHLGASLGAIAREKAGIMRPGKITLLGDLAEEPLAAIREVAGAIGSRLVMACEGSSIREYPRLATPLRGAHQLKNALLAVRAAELLEGVRCPIDARSIASGLAATRWPGRIEAVEGRPALLLDGAHNPAGARSLAEYLATTGLKPVLLFGSMRDKDSAGMLEVLLPHVSGAIFTRPRMERASEPSALREIALGAALPAPPAGGYHVASDARDGLAAARGLAGPEGVVLVAGSLYLVGEVKAMLEEQAP